MTRDPLRPMTVVPVDWDEARCAFVVRLPGKELLAIDEADARRKAYAYVGTGVSLRFPERISYPRAKR